MVCGVRFKGCVYAALGDEDVAIQEVRGEECEPINAHVDSVLNPPPESRRLGSDLMRPRLLTSEAAGHHDSLRHGASGLLIHIRPPQVFESVQPHSQELLRVFVETAKGRPWSKENIDTLAQFPLSELPVISVEAHTSVSHSLLSLTTGIPSCRSFLLTHSRLYIPHFSHLL